MRIKPSTTARASRCVGGWLNFYVVSKLVEEGFALMCAWLKLLLSGHLPPKKGISLHTTCALIKMIRLHQKVMESHSRACLSSSLVFVNAVWGA